MKIIQINVVYGKGSTGRLTQLIHEHLVKSGHESRIIYGRGKKNSDPYIVKAAPEIIMKFQSLLSRITGLAFANAQYSTKKIINYIRKFQPDVTHIHCANSSTVNIYKLLNFLKDNQYKTVITLHAEFMYTAGCSYSIDCERWKTGCFQCPQFNKERPKSWFFDRSRKEWNLMKDAYSEYNNLAIVGVSDWITNRAKESIFFKNKIITTILNGVDVNQFQNINSNLFDEYHRTGYKVVLHVTPDFESPIKGGRFIYELAERFQGKDVIFCVVGTSAKGKDVQENLIFIEKTNSTFELAKYYTAANLTVLLSKRETFSMITAESLCCGTPIVGFEAGAPEMIALKEYSEFVTYGDVDMLELTISKWLNMNFDNNKISSTARKKYSNKNMTSSYIKLFEEL